jgi:hypothetical protein
MIEHTNFSWALFGFWRGTLLSQEGNLVNINEEVFDHVILIPLDAGAFAQTAPLFPHVCLCLCL